MFKTYPNWLINKGWASVSQAFINEKVVSLPDRMRAVLHSDDKMTGY